MRLNIESEVRRMRHMHIAELKAHYEDVTGEPARSNNRDYLVKRVAWRMQCREEGDLPERARRRALELADDAELRRRPTEGWASAATPAARAVQGLRVNPRSELRVGTVLTRTYKGRLVEVRVLEKGFEFEGRRFRSLTAVTRELTGSNWNGRHFFGLSGRKEAV